MPTFKVLILKHQKTENDTYGVKIRITHNRQSKYLATSFHVKDKQLTGKFEIKDRSILKNVEEDIDQYWEILKKLPDVSRLTVSELLTTLEKEKAKSHRVEVDFIAFSMDHIEKLKVKDGEKYASSFKTTINSVCDFLGRDKVLISEITTKFLTNYEIYLKSDRIIVRYNQFKKPVTTTQIGMGNGALTYLTNIRTLFNAARYQYNDEDEGIITIPHYPFRKFKLGKKESINKRSVKPDIIKKIISYTEVKPTRASLGRDVFMISFYLLGTNLIDLYEAVAPLKGRFIYNRSKTEARRDDDAFISIKVVGELLPLLETYKDPSGKRAFSFYKSYTTSETFINAVNIGLSKVSTALELNHNLTSYYARHSWATIARNNCSVSKEDISMALNHVDTMHKVTDSYLDIDWSIIDNANTKVLNLFRPRQTVEGRDNEIFELLENNELYENLDQNL
jgi:hypothetical protein